MSDVEKSLNYEEPTQSENRSNQETPLSIPSLFDFLLSQEKLAAEIRKQNKEMRLMSHRIQDVMKGIADIEMRMSSQNEDCPDEPLAVSLDETAMILMETLDGVWNLLKSGRDTFQTIVSITPKGGLFGFFRKPKWRSSFEKILQGHIDGIGIIENKIISSLAEAHISVLVPNQDDAFDPLYHKVIDTIDGGRQGKIAHVIQCGYLKDGVILRYAHVSIY